MILFNNYPQFYNNCVGTGDHTVPLAHHKYNRIITGKNICLTGEGLGYTFYFLIESEFQRYCTACLSFPKNQKYTLTAMPTDDKLTKVRILTRAVKLMGIEPNVV